MNILKWLGYILLLGLFIWFVFFRNFRFNTDKTEPIQDSETLASEPTPMVDDEASFIDQPIEEFQSEEPLEEFVEDDVELEVLEEASDISSTGIDLNKKYLIVVGSFGSRSNAERMLKRVQESGKDGKIEKIRGLNRVITASSDDQNDAQNLRDHFTHIYKETAFILER